MDDLECEAIKHSFTLACQRLQMVFVKAKQQCRVLSRLSAMYLYSNMVSAMGWAAAQR
jgi:hypothetical protein